MDLYIGILVPLPYNGNGKPGLVIRRLDTSLGTVVGSAILNVFYTTWMKINPIDSPLFCNN